MSNHDREGPQSRDQGAAKDAAQDTAQVTALKRAWQEASDEQPPPGLDAAIIAAARKAVQDRGAEVATIDTGRRARNRWMRWQPLAAAASVAGLAFVLVQLMPRDHDVAPTIRMEEPAPGPATAEEKQESSAREATVPQAAATSGATTSTATVQETTAEARADVTPPAVPAPQAKAEVSDYDTAAAPARERRSDNAAPMSAADRAARIEALYASGDATGAADALRAFRAIDPEADKYLPDSLRSWALTVK